MGTFKVLYWPEDPRDPGPGSTDELTVEVEGWDESNWHDEEFAEALMGGFEKQHVGLDSTYVEDWWPESMNYSHLTGNQEST